MATLTRAERVLYALAAVVIATALSVNAAMNVLQRIDSAAFYERTSNLMAGGEGEVREVEVETFVYETSAHFTGEPGEEVTVNLSPGVWEVLGGGSNDDLNIQTRLSSSSSVSTWTGFRNVISVLPMGEYEAMSDQRGLVMPEGPMTLAVSGDQQWSVDFLRVVCPGDYEPF